MSQNWVCRNWPPGLFTQQADAELAAVEQLSTDPEHVALVLKMEAPVLALTRDEAARVARTPKTETAMLVNCSCRTLQFDFDGVVL